MRSLEKIFVGGALLSGVLNIMLVFYITHNRFQGTGSPFNDRPDDSPTVIVKKDNGGNPFSIEVYRNNDIVSQGVQNGYGWEYDTLNTLNSLFRDYSLDNDVPLSDLTFLDIGANVGWFTFNLAALGVNVIAFEPMQENIDLIKSSLQQQENIDSGVSGRITLYEHGLGAKDDTCFLYSDNGNVGDGHVKCVEKESDLNMEDNYAVRGRVIVKRLDDVIQVKDGMKLVGIKMDAEGFEGNVMEGGSKVLLEGGADAIISEFVPDQITSKGGDPISFMKKAKKAGFLAKKNGSWGYEYFSEEEMLDMSNFGQSMVSLHSSYQQNKTNTAKLAWEKEDAEMQEQMKQYEGFDNEFGGNEFGGNNFEKYYENNRTSPTIKTENLGKEFAIEVYKEKDIVSNSITAYWNGWENDLVKDLNKYFQDYSEKHTIPLANLTFIDIGANLGWLSLNMAALGVKVIAFEPMEENIKLLKYTLNKTMNVENGISSRITLYEHGLGEKEETCFIYSDDLNVGDGHVQCVEKESDLKIQANYTVRGKAHLKRLDDVINPEGMHIVAVKMDTEGYEGNILKGGEKVLLHGGVDALLTEFVPDWVTQKGGDPVELMTKITEAGYRAKKNGDDWGYMSKRDMMNMTKFGKDDVTFHSNNLVKEFMGEN